MNNSTPSLNWSAPNLADDGWIFTAQTEKATLITFRCEKGWGWQIYVSRRVIARGVASTTSRAQVMAEHALAERYNNERRTA